MNNEIETIKTMDEICECGHLKSEHLNTPYEKGHGACNCKKFTWKGFSEKEYKEKTCNEEIIEDDFKEGLQECIDEYFIKTLKLKSDERGYPTYNGKYTFDRAIRDSDGELTDEDEEINTDLEVKVYYNIVVSEKSKSQQSIQPTTQPTEQLTTQPKRIMRIIRRPVDKGMN